jgi:CheY-like chemotaxis protein
MSTADPTAPNPRPRLLLIDDEPLIGMVVQRMFAADYDVVPTTSAAKGLQILSRDGPFAVILCDLMMPERTGMDVYAELVRTHPEHARRMVFLTGGAFSPETNAFLDQVPNERIVKPFDAKQFHASLQRALR